MSTKLFVGNLPYTATEEELKALFAPYGEVGEVVVIRDKFSGRSRGFAFVEIMDETIIDKVIEEMNGKEMGGRNIVVNISKPKTEGPRSFDGADRRPRGDFNRNRF